MKLTIIAILLMSLLFGCKQQEDMGEENAPSVQKEDTMSSKISKDEVLKITRNDAATAYRDLSDYKVEITLVDGNWKVDYELREEHLAGGGPHYLISGETGEIIEKRYEQ